MSGQRLPDSNATLFDRACHLVNTEKRNLQPIHCRKCGTAVYPSPHRWVEDDVSYPMCDGMCPECAWMEGADEPADLSHYPGWLREFLSDDEEAA